MKKCNSLIAGAILSALSLTTLPSMASVNSSDGIEQLAVESKAIIYGKIADIQYKDSVEGIPHTFVTYDIIEDFDGYHSGEQITLKFIGGIRKVSEQEYDVLEVSNVPTFTMDSENILFLKRKADSQCPLVKCSEGLFRVRSDEVFSSTGQAVGINKREEMHSELDGYGENIVQVMDSKVVQSKGVSLAEFKRAALKGFKKGMPIKLESADIRKAFSVDMLADEAGPRVPKKPAARNAALTDENVQ